MKTTTMIVIAAMLAFGEVSARAQQPDKMQEMDAKTHRELMPVHAKLVEEMKRQEAELAPLLAEMNRAAGEKRVDALIAVMNKLVEQRKAMQEKLAAGLGR